MKNTYILSMLLFLFSCHTAEQTETVRLDIKDTTAFVKSDTLKTAEQTTIDFALPFTEKIELFIGNFSGDYDTVENIKSILPDRFSSEYKRVVALRKKTPVKYGETENVYPVAYLFFYQYKDSSSFQNVQSNWYGCFGNDCFAIVPGENIRSIKTTPSFTILNSRRKEIIHLYYLCEHQENNWQDFIRQLTKDFAEREAVKIEVACGGPLKWL